MGLFGGGKKCCICGGKAGLLTRMKLSDGEYVCGDCTLKVSDQLKSDDYRRMTKAGFERCLADAPANDQKYRGEFNETFSIYAGSGNSHKALSADETHGWWVCAEYNRPIVFTFDEIQSWNVRMNTVSETDDDDKDKGIADMFAEFAKSSYFASMRANHPELPTCPPGQKVTSMDVYVSVANPYVRDAIIDVWEPGWFSDQMTDMQNAYSTAIQIIEYFQRVKRQGGMAQTGASSSFGGGYQRMGQAAQQPQQTTAAPADPTAELRKYKSLLDEGIISQAEFDAKKRQLLGI